MIKHAEIYKIKIEDEIRYIAKMYVTYRDEMIGRNGGIMKFTLTVKECATFLEMTEETLRSGLRTATLDVGAAIITGYTMKNGKKIPRYRYHIPLKKAENHMGIEYKEWLKQREA